MAHDGKRILFSAKRVTNADGLLFHGVRSMPYELAGDVWFAPRASTGTRAQRPSWIA